MSSDHLQSKLVSIRTVADPLVVVHEILAKCPEAVVCWARHVEEGKVPHAHLMVRFPSVRRWGWLRDWLNVRDAHNYSKPADSWRRGVRYLLHLDNPEKAVVPRSEFCSVGLDEDEQAQLLAGRSSNILPALREVITGGMSPYDAFAFLVERKGFRPSECTSAINLLISLNRAKHVRDSLSVGFCMPETNDERFDRLDDEAIDESLFNDDFRSGSLPDWD